MRDAALTDIGVEQASSMRQGIQELNPSLIITSPLSRSLHTTSEACADVIASENCSVMVHPVVREHAYANCDIGSSPNCLAEKWKLWSDQLSAIPEEWWLPEDPAVVYSGAPSPRLREPWQNLQNRAKRLVIILRDQIAAGHKRILVVGHAVLFYALLNRWVSNCELVELDLNAVRPPCSCEGYVCHCDC